MGGAWTPRSASASVGARKVRKRPKDAQKVLSDLIIYYQRFIIGLRAVHVFGVRSCLLTTTYVIFAVADAWY
jgi:hypothetical protein